MEFADALALATDPADPAELFRLMVGRIEARAPGIGRSDLAAEWETAKRRRRGEQPVLSAVPAALKMMFDFYFRNDLYGHWIDSAPLVLSSGSFDETVFGLPESLKECIRFSLDKNWYGYSDSLGRTSVRQALADLETTRFGGTQTINSDEIVVTLGGTAAVAAIVDFLAPATGAPGTALCGVPNYPPLIAAVDRRFDVELVTTPPMDGQTDITALIERARAGARLILLQTVTNPHGLRVPEEQIARLVAAAPDDCVIVLDECHDTFGPPVPLSPARRSPKVVTIRSISKRWCAPGLKAGWLVASPAFVADFYHHASTTYGGPPSIFYLFLEIFARFEAGWLGGRFDAEAELARLSDDYGLRRETLQAAYGDYLHWAADLEQRVVRQRRHAVDALRALDVPVVEPDYSINLVAQLGDDDSYVTYRRLISEAGVSVYPGLLSLQGGRGLVRISPCIPEEILADALHRIGGFLHRAQ